MLGHKNDILGDSKVIAITVVSSASCYRSSNLDLGKNATGGADVLSISQRLLTSGNTV